MNGVAVESLLQMSKVPCKSKVIAPNGLEVVWEIITKEDNLGFGMAVADIIKSAPHFHKKMFEIYILVSGILEVFVNSKSKLLSLPGEGVRILPERNHWARSYGEKIPARVLVWSYPAWTLEDHHLMK